MVITESWGAKILEAVAERYGFGIDQPFRDLDDDARRIVMLGNGGERVEVKYRARNGNIHTFRTTFEGVVPNLARRYRETGSEAVKTEIERYMTTKPCPTCGHAAQARVAVGHGRAAEHHPDHPPSVTDALAWYAALPERLTRSRDQIARQVRNEILRVTALPIDVGAGLPDPGLGRAARYPGVRRRDPAGRRRSGRALWAAGHPGRAVDRSAPA